MEEPFRPLTTHWISKIKLAVDFKKENFQKDADECMRFFNGPYEFMYGLKYSRGSESFTFSGTEGNMPKPSFCMTVNKAAEMVQLFGPVLYHRNPVRTVTPRKQPQLPPAFFGDPNDPQAFMAMQQMQMGQSMDEARAALISHYINTTPNSLDLKTECRRMIDEALIKGMGVLWHEVYHPRGGNFRMVGSFHDTVDNLVIDPDCESLTDAKWIARKCTHPVWQVEQEYGLPPGTLKGNLESTAQQTQINAAADYDRKRGLTNDLLEYWKIYSKMGMGSKLSGITPDMAQFDQFGENVYLVVCDTLPYPINLPPESWADPAQVEQRLQWETPYWTDDTWPFTPLSFHWIPRKVWPMSHLKPGMGELKFINWAYSFLAGKVRTACRDLVAVAKSATEEMKRVLVSGTDYELLEIEKAHGTISEVVQFLQHPPFHGDIYKVISAVEDNFDKRVGLTELMYGSSASQYRSAAEAQVKSDQLRIRPDDMTSKVEDAMSDAARKEAFAARWHLDGNDVMPILGQFGAQMWDQIVAAADPSVLIHSLETRIEAGSARKPNKDKEVADANSAMQTLFQPLYQYATLTADVRPVNALITMWAKAQDIEPGQFLLQPPPPPPTMDPQPAPKQEAA